MRKTLIVLSVLLLAATLTAQVRTGNIYGKVTDSEGNILPGVSVVLKSPQMAPLTTVTGSTGLYRFVSLSPGDAYELTAELSGFKKATKTGIIVQIGSNVMIDLVMEVGTLEEQVTVVATTPVIETKKTTVGQNLNKETLQSLPSARDPWVILQLAPSIMVDRENVGGNESGQQSGFIARGDTTAGRVSGNQGANNIWAVDGIDVTDTAALGGSANYYDFDMFEELNVTVGGAADVTVQTGGVALNMVTRRGGNRMSLAGRFYLTDNFFQSSNITPELQALGVLDTNKIQAIKDYGFNAGGPIIKDKLWWWGAYGVQDIFTWTLPTRSGIGVTTAAAKNQATLNNYNFKINAQLLPNNRFEALVTSGAKELFGRNASVEKPEGDHQTGKYHWGSPIVKLQDEHVFGNNFFLSLKYSFNDPGFGWRPIPDESVQYPIVYDNSLGKYVPYATGMNASWGSYGVSRPRNNAQIQGTYFNDTFLGASHEIKFGAEYSHKEQSTVSTGTGNIQGFNITQNYIDLQLDANADGTRTTAEMAGWKYINMYRRSGSASIAQQWAAYLQDTMVKGNFTLSLGLRFDKQWSGQGAYTRDAILPGTPAWDRVFSTESSNILDAILPDVSVDPVKGIAQVVNGSDRPYQWNVFSPRIGLTWDIFGTGKTVAKLALSQYGDVMGVGWYTANPYGTGGAMRYWWRDANANNKADFDELYWNYSSRYPVATGDPSVPSRYVPYRVFADATGTLTTAAYNMLHDRPSIFDSDAYYAGRVADFDWYNPLAIDYERGVTSYFWDHKSQNSARTREILLTLEHELLADFSVQLNASYRKFDRDMSGYRYYAAEHSDEYPGMWAAGVTPTDIVVDEATIWANNWYYEAPNAIPDTFNIGGTFTGSPTTGYTWAHNDTYPEGDPRHGTTYSSELAAGRSYWLPNREPGPDGILGNADDINFYPTTSSRYTLYKLNDDWYTYYGVDLVFNKRLSNKWMMNGSLTWQGQRAYWGKEFGNPTNQWMSDGKPYGDWGGSASGKVSVLMYTRWMAKLSGMYQLPWGFNVSGTFNAREGWRVPHYFVLDDYDARNYTSSHANTIYTMVQVQDHLPTFYNITFRIEKKINIGAGRFYLMADVFNLLNSNMPIRSYSDNFGTAYYRMAGPAGAQTFQQYNSAVYNYTGLYNEVLNPRVWRFGVRFEF
ncbi:MAG TPA: carboxypeptidase-like regulatory domain-containing protein [Acidobacteriota bacterium]|nr:carboxypeptidase-like regulatory domain-containing protein [Acidobacteriota bacterium]